MNFIKGKRLKRQPHRLKYGLSLDYFISDDKDKIRKRPDMDKWCSDNIETSTIHGYVQQNWFRGEGFQYCYYFFENEKTATMFKLIWG